MRTTSTAVCVVFAVFAVLLSGPSGAGSAVDEPGARVFEGQYQWVNMDNPGPLRAEFTATGENLWDVDFHFRFDGRDRTYSGTAEGSLTGGEIQGEVQNENNRRTFTFKAEIEDGHLDGTHRETTPSRARRTGTMDLTELVSDS